MAAPTYRAKESTFGFSSSPATTIPAGAIAGDRAILVVTSRAAQVSATPTGWTPRENSGTWTPSLGRIYIYETEVSSTGDVDPGDPVAVSMDASSGWTISVTAASPCEIDDFAVDLTGDSDPTDTNPPASASTDALVLYVHGSITTPNGAQAILNADAATTARVQECTNATAGQRNAIQLVATETIVAGAVPTRTVTLTQVGDVTTTDWQQQAATIVLTEVVARPTVDAGDDQSIIVDGAFSVTGEVTGDGGGAGGPYVPAWRIVSDTTGGAILDANDALTVTGSAGPNAGSIVLGFKVTDSGSVESEEDTLTITVVGAGDVARPIADVNDPIAAGWVPSTGTTVWEVISDNSDVTYVRSPNAPIAVELRNDLTPLTQPGSNDPVTFGVRVRRNEATSASVDFAIVEGASTLIAQSTGNAIAAGSTFVEITLTLTPTEKAAVTNWGDLDSVVTVTAAE